MAHHKRRDVLRRRRRTADEDDEAELDSTPAADGSQSDASTLTDVDNGLDVDDDEQSEAASARVAGDANTKSSNPYLNRGNEVTVLGSGQEMADGKPPTFVTSRETEVMMNGLKIGGTGSTDGDTAIEFDHTVAPQSNGTAHHVATEGSSEQTNGPVAAQPKIHSRYGVKHDNAPAIPNRGGFFMHDQRTSKNAMPNGSGALGRARGRGRGGFAGPILSSGHHLAYNGGSMGKWDHDLHESVANPLPRPREPAYNNNPGLSNTTSSGQPSLSKTTSVGTVLLRVLLPEMSEPINFDKTPVRQHTRLPDLRPPLRRDKPVRVSLPGQQSPRYIFPSTERSFIFIPRAQRPNQQRMRSRGSHSHFGSRRTSMYGGSNYTPSVARSRRSSRARDSILSPADPAMSRVPIGAGGGRPIVKLPGEGTTPVDASAATAGYGAMMDGQGAVSRPYPLPQPPALRENRPAPIPIHQPKPLKTVAVPTVNSPAPDNQPFHQQVPGHHQQGPSSQDTGSSYPHSRHMSFSGQWSGGSGAYSSVSDRFVNAPPFQPGNPPAQPYYSPSYPAAGMIYYPVQEGYGYPPPPPGPPGQPGGYYMPVYMPPPPAPPPPATTATSNEQQAQEGQNGTYAHESNGMVYYYNSSQMAGGGGMDGLASGNYGIPEMQAGPEGYYYPPAPGPMMYYPGQ